MAAEVFESDSGFCETDVTSRSNSSSRLIFLSTLGGWVVTPVCARAHRVPGTSNARMTRRTAARWPGRRRSRAWATELSSRTALMRTLLRCLGLRPAIERTTAQPSARGVPRAAYGGPRDTNGVTGPRESACHPGPDWCGARDQ